MIHTKFLVFVLMDVVISGRMTRSVTLKEDDPEDHEYQRNDESFSLKTMGCIIPSVNIQDKLIKKIESKENIEECKHYNNHLLESNRTHIWVKKKNFKYYNIYNPSNFICCYQSFHRPQSARNVSPDNFDSSIQYHNCIYFKNTIKANNEFVKVICFNNDPDEPIYEQMFVFARKKPFTAARENPFMMPTHQSTYNVIIMGMGSLSRQNFYRTMSNTVELLRSHNAIELKGYSRVATNTFQNIMPMLVGLSESDVNSTCLSYKHSTLDSCPFVWEGFKDVGYYTALMEDTSRLSMFDRGSFGFSGRPTDYYVHPFLRQSEIMQIPNSRSKDKHITACLGDKYNFQVLLKYVQDITTTLKGFKFFGFFWESSMTRDSLKGSVMMDLEYLRLVKNLEATNYLQDTIMIFMSDHGVDIENVRSQQSRIEQRMPLFFILVPPSFQKHYNLAYRNLMVNEGRLTTPFDVHKTLLDLMYMAEITDDKIKKRSTEFYSHERGISLFLEIPRNRTCRMAGIDPTWCACNDEVPVDSSSPLVVAAVKFITHEINRILMPYPECHKLELDEIIIAKEMVPVYESITEWRDYKLIVSLVPGGGIFEAMLRYHNNKWIITETIKRVNCLGFQSLCVEDPVIKLLCYCKPVE